MWQETYLDVHLKFHPKSYQRVLKYLKFDTMMKKKTAGRTANEISKVTGCSLSTVQRNLYKLLNDKHVDFVVVIRKGKPAREWFVV